MNISPDWKLLPEEQNEYINSLTSVLSSLRARAGISQAELANLVGLTRQTISMTESRKRPMSWSTYLALVMFFDYNQSTHQMLRDLAVFPTKLVERFNSGNFFENNNNLLNLSENAKDIAEMLQCLDSRGMHSVRSMLLMEYTRCSNSDKKTELI